MTSPAPRRGGIVFLDPEQGRVLRVVPFQYNPDSIVRTLRPRGIGADAGDRLEALRLQGPARETFRVDAELDATDRPGAAGGPAPAVHPGQRVELLVGGRPVAAEPFTRATGTLRFRLAAGGPGRYPLRLRVDGVDSPLTDGDTGRFDADTAVVIT